MSKRENARRATRANKTVKFYANLGGGDDGIHTNMVDLVADLMHLARRKNLDFHNDVVRISQEHFEAEEGGEP